MKEALGNSALKDTFLELKTNTWRKHLRTALIWSQSIRLSDTVCSSEDIYFGWQIQGEVLVRTKGVTDKGRRAYGI